MLITAVRPSLLIWALPAWAPVVMQASCWVTEFPVNSPRSEVTPSIRSLISTRSVRTSTRSTRSEMMRDCSAGKSSFHSGSNASSELRTSDSVKPLISCPDLSPFYRREFGDCSLQSRPKTEQSRYVLAATPQLASACLATIGNSSPSRQWKFFTSRELALML